MEYTIERTEVFTAWLSGLDKTDRQRLAVRLNRLENGNFGDHKEISENLFELRCFFGDGLRVYYTIRNATVVLLLAGGNKDTQSRSIERAREMLRELMEE
ncbi:MAG: type II toxin-antitoxin system RelE/ParE family toxin [Azoarcus sp.]|jgi:putative addiction module killer protein|nr:type II toxin-antitoxin system RelE/ParE family toxin [Azoarcus sp.]